ncbi:DinB family protein [Geothrix fuzhouensis]|uniref:DinB family protein n=1 Tax=Geothrix fuzhouensis TaxID=2966451 RepID=UPI0021498B72|nr:DinB family protein [Geothrix fuzhouensis]
MTLSRPLRDEYAEGYAPYIAAADEGDVLDLLQAQMEDIATLFGGFSEAQGAFRYAPGKWSLKDLLQHLCDAERIFAYRCLRIGRGDATPMPGFEEDPYAVAAKADARAMADLVADWRAVRTASLTLFRSLPEAAWLNQGTTNNRSITARCIPFISLGHAAHHLAVIRERYLPALK